MVILIAGDTHSGKTLLAQKLLEKYQYPYLSIDHKKWDLSEADNVNSLPKVATLNLQTTYGPLLRKS